MLLRIYHRYPKIRGATQTGNNAFYFILPTDYCQLRASETILPSTHESAFTSLFGGNRVPTSACGRKNVRDDPFRLRPALLFWATTSRKGRTRRGTCSSCNEGDYLSRDCGQCSRHARRFFIYACSRGYVTPHSSKQNLTKLLQRIALWAAATVWLVRMSLGKRKVPLSFVEVPHRRTEANRTGPKRIRTQGK